MDYDSRGSSFDTLMLSLQQQTCSKNSMTFLKVSIIHKYIQIQINCYIMLIANNNNTISSLEVSEGIMNNVRCLILSLVISILLIL